jgi:hypothetical protein
MKNDDIYSGYSDVPSDIPDAIRAAEAEAVYDHAVSRRLDAIKVATSRWRSVREAAHRSERLSRRG